MDDMEKDLMSRYKELAFSRRATLQALLEVVQSSHTPPDERLIQVELLIKSAGITLWKNDNPTG